MKCPQCSTLLVRAVRGGVPIDGCLACGGTFVERPFLRPAPNEESPASGSAPGGESYADRAIGCPRCTTLMERERFPRAGILIDRCPRCHGIWLDARDLEAVEIGLPPTGPEPRDPHPAGTAPSAPAAPSPRRERTPLSGRLATPSLFARIAASVAGAIAAGVAANLLLVRPPYIPPDFKIFVGSAAAGVLLFLLIPVRQVAISEDGSVEIVRRRGILRRSRTIANHEIAYLGSSFQHKVRSPWIMGRILLLHLGSGLRDFSALHRRAIVNRVAKGYSLLPESGTCALDLVLHSGERVRICRLLDDQRFSGIIDYFRAALGVEARRDG
ncbi:MAG: zf-TFIIB domain-containing protein [Planctomycetes bacterium]|nr:zf-TFIIB domain-containing protein [Planctomycetota bacterium]